MKKLLVAVLALACAASAQTLTTMLIDSPWSVWDNAAKHVISAQLLRKDATTGALVAIAGQKVTPGGLSFWSPQATAAFPGQKSSDMTVAGIRLLHSAAGTGWDMPEHPINVTFPAPLVVPAGHSLGCVYLMPKLGKGSLTCTVDGQVTTGVALPPAPPAPAPAPAPVQAPTPAPSASTSTISALRVVDNATAGGVLLALAEGTVLELATLPKSLNIEALASSTAGVLKVTFALDAGAFTQTEMNAPYALCGDWNACPAAVFAPGQHTLVVTPFDSAGKAGTPTTVHFTVK